MHRGFFVKQICVVANLKIASTMNVDLIPKTNFNSYVRNSVRRILKRFAFRCAIV